MDQGDIDRFRRRSVEAHYSEAMILADEARSYFEGMGVEARDALTGTARVHFACESLKVTTRLMHVVAWLLAQRAVAVGELSDDADTPAQRLGPGIESDDDIVAMLPADAQAIVCASIALFAAVARLEASKQRAPMLNPALLLHARLAAAF